MKDLRLAEVQARDSMAFGIKETIGTLVGGGILMMLGLYAYSKVGSKIDQNEFTAAENTTMTNIKTNITSGFDIASVVFIVIAVVAIIGVIYLAFR